MCTNENDLPYYSSLHNAYFFYDEIGESMGPYRTYKIACKEMKRYAYWLDHGPTLWQRFWWPIRYGAAAWLVSLRNAASNSR